MPHKLPFKQYKAEKLTKQVQKLATKIHPDDLAAQEVFCEALLSQSARTPSVFWLSTPPVPRPFVTTTVASWQPDWVDVITEDAKASHRQDYYNGSYYVLDFSSVTTASPLLTIPKQAKILDVCSSPGGKAIFAARIHKPDELVCNEVVPKRHGALKSNLNRCKIEAEITKIDPQLLRERFHEYFDLVMVDAPCSGQSLVARGIDAEGAFLDHMVNANMTRQRRILANSALTAKAGGYMLYTTCTYAYEENEKNVKWFLRTHPDWKTVEVEHLKPYQSNMADVPCYRIEPQYGLGAGGFSCLFQKIDNLSTK